MYGEPERVNSTACVHSIGAKLTLRRKSNIARRSSSFRPWTTNTERAVFSVDTAPSLPTRLLRPHLPGAQRHFPTTRRCALPGPPAGIGGRDLQRQEGLAYGSASLVWASLVRRAAISRSRLSAAC